MKLLSIPGHQVVVEIPEAEGMTITHHATMDEKWIVIFENSKAENMIVIIDMETKNYQIIEG